VTEASGYARFQRDVLKTVADCVVPAFEADPRSRQALHDHLFGKVQGTPQRTPTDRERFIGVVFQGFMEIDRSLETLQDIAYYMGRFPFKGTRITPERYLQFNVEAYLVEVHLLKERLEAYQLKMMRRYKGDPALPPLREVFTALQSAIFLGLKDMVTLRGAHVHQVRYQSPDIARLGTIGLLARNGMTQMQIYFRLEYPRVRKTWKKHVNELSEGLRGVLDLYFDALHSLMFDSSTRALRFPRGL
jgi:hypothetical protein